MSYPLEILPYHERASKIDRWYAQDLGRNIATKDRKYLGDRRRKYPDLSRRDLKKMLLEDDYKEYKRMQVIRDEADNEYKAVLATQKERCPDGLDSLANLRLAWRSDRVYSADKPHIEGRIKHLIGDEDGSYPGETLAHRNRLERDNHLGYLFQATNEAKKHNQNTEKHRKGIRNHSPSLREASPDSLEWLDFERRGRPTARLSSRPPSLSRTVSPHTPANLRPHCCPRSERVRPPSPSLHTSHIRPRSRSTLRNILSAPTDSRSRTSRSPSLSSVPRVTLPPPSAYIRRGSFDRTVLPPSRASPISAPRVNLPPPTAFPSTFNLPPPSSFPSSSRRRSSSSGSSIRRRLSALQAMD